MTTVGVDSGSLQADSQPKSGRGLRGGGRLALSLHSSNEPSELFIGLAMMTELWTLALLSLLFIIII